MNQQQNQEPFGYVATINWGLALSWWLESSVMWGLRRDQGWRIATPRRALHGLVTGSVCIIAVQGADRNKVSDTPKYFDGLGLFWVIYLALLAIRFRQQREQLSSRTRIHPWSTGWPVIWQMFPKASYESLIRLEVVLLFALGWLSELCRLPYCLWLCASALALIARSWFDRHVQALADSDQLAARLDAEHARERLRRIADDPLE